MLSGKVINSMQKNKSIKVFRNARVEEENLILMKLSSMSQWKSDI